ncbi:xanthine dehydrogenase small subunit [soil metagenome]
MLRFLLDGQPVERADIAPTLTVLQLLRDDLGRTGTKEGCAEGDCGACTVLIGTPDAEGAPCYRPVNACIRFAATIDGCELVTAESLVQADGSLHPVQQAMVDQHASQCGFCTPGFVMSLASLYLEHDSVDRNAVVDGIAGNLCRCTGYRPIIDAGLAMHRYPSPARWARPRSDADADRSRALEALDDASELVLDTGHGFVAPRTREGVDAALAAHHDALLLAGGTDIGLWVTKQMRELPAIVWLGAVDGLDAIEVGDDQLVIGATATLADAYEALARQWPPLHELGARFASPPIRNSGTLGGNVANGSPIGDSMPILLALGASVRLRRDGRSRELPLDEFYLGYWRNALTPREWLEAFCVPIGNDPRQRLASYKVSKRIEQDISAVCLGIALSVDDAGIVRQARIAYGGMAATPARARACEQAWLGKRFDEAGAIRAASALADDFAPIDDFRASAAYRMNVAGNLLRRFALEHGPDATRRSVRILHLQPVGKR